MADDHIGIHLDSSLCCELVRSVSDADPYGLGRQVLVLAQERDREEMAATSQGCSSQVLGIMDGNGLAISGAAILGNIGMGTVRLNGEGLLSIPHQAPYQYRKVRMARMCARQHHPRHLREDPDWM